MTALTGWTASAFMTEMQSRFEAADELAGVTTWTAPTPKLKGENILFLEVDGEQEWSAIGNQSKDDIYTIRSVAIVAQKGSGEETATRVRERAAEVIAGVEAVLRHIVSEDELSEVAEAIGAVQITKLNLARFTLTQGFNPEMGRWAQMDFDIQVTARI